MYRNQRNYENLEKRIFAGAGKYGMPCIEPIHFKRKVSFIPFNYAKSAAASQDKGIHFFLDDYQFNRLWSSPKKYVMLFRKFSCVMSPDFSIYEDFPLIMQLYNHYRKHWLAAYWQENGIAVIPTISWSNDESFNWCFDGEPTHSTVAVSSVGTQNSRERKQKFLIGYREMLCRLQPETIIFHGNVPEECKNNSNIIEIGSYQERFKNQDSDISGYQTDGEGNLWQGK